MPDEKPPDSFRDIVQDFLELKCTSHGYPRCRSGVSMGSATRRVFWCFVALAFTGYGSWQIYLTVADFYSYPKITSTEVRQPKDVPFPSVTICPLQAVRSTSEEKYMKAFAFYYTIHPKEKDKSIWKDLILNMKMVDEELRFFERVEKILMQKQRNLNETSIDEFLQILQIKDLYSNDTIGYLKEVHKIRIMNAEQAPFAGESNIWTRENAGTDQRLAWLNGTWNGKYFDIPRYFKSTYNDTFIPLNQSKNLFMKLLTRNIDNFRVSLQTDVPNSNAREELRPLFTLVAWGKQIYNISAGAFDGLGRYILFRYLHPYAFHDTDIFYSCLLQGVNCAFQFYISIHPRWKACYTFNNQIANFLPPENQLFRVSRNGSTRDSLRLQAAGKDSGLSLRLRTRPDDTRLSMLSPIGGYVVAIGDSATMPRWDLHILVPNSGHTDVALKRTEITRLDSENGGDCQHEDYFGDVFPQYEIIGVYDQNICSQLLVFFNILEECSCLMSSDVMGGIVGIENLIRQYESCSYETIPCTDYARNLALKSSFKTCPPACREVKIDISVSTVPYNVNGTAASAALEWLEKQPDCLLIQTESCDFQSFSTLNIFYTSPSVEIIQETLFYTTYSFIATLGGLAGLYIGMSLVSVVEVVELVFDLLTFPLCRRLRQRQNISPSRDSQSEIRNEQSTDIEERLAFLEKQFHRLQNRPVNAWKNQ